MYAELGLIKEGTFSKQVKTKYIFTKTRKLHKNIKGALFLLESTVCQMSFDCTFELVEIFYSFDFLGR